MRPLTPERCLVNRDSKIAAEDSASHLPIPSSEKFFMLPCGATFHENILRSVAQTAAFWRAAAFRLKIPNRCRPAKRRQVTGLVIDSFA